MVKRRQSDPGAPADGVRVKSGASNMLIQKAENSDRLDRLSRFHDPNDYYGEVSNFIDYSSFFANAKIGDGLQVILDPREVSRSLSLSRQTLLRLHRLHSEYDFTLIKGHLDRTLVVTTAEYLLDAWEGRL